jgi:hypothetical protein
MRIAWVVFAAGAAVAAYQLAFANHVGVARLAGFVDALVSRYL